MWWKNHRRIPLVAAQFLLAGSKRTGDMSQKEQKIQECQIRLSSFASPPVRRENTRLFQFLALPISVFPTEKHWRRNSTSCMLRRDEPRRLPFSTFPLSMRLKMACSSRHRRTSSRAGSPVPRPFLPSMSAATAMRVFLADHIAPMRLGHQER